MSGSCYLEHGLDEPPTELRRKYGQIVGMKIHENMNGSASKPASRLSMNENEQLPYFFHLFSSTFQSYFSFVHLYVSFNVIIFCLRRQQCGPLSQCLCSFPGVNGVDR
jgi:hypothetical protein